MSDKLLGPPSDKGRRTYPFIIIFEDGHCIPADHEKLLGFHPDPQGWIEFLRMVMSHGPQGYAAEMSMAPENRPVTRFKLIRSRDLGSNPSFDDPFGGNRLPGPSPATRQAVWETPVSPPD